MAEASVPAGAQEPGVSEHLEAACVEISYAGAHRFKIESWGPFAEGKNDLFRNLVLTGIGAEHAKSVGQVVLRWLTQRGVIVIPKSVRRERMRENMDIFDFQLTDEQMTQIAGLDGGVSLFFDHRDPERVSWLNRRAE